MDVLQVASIQSVGVAFLKNTKETCQNAPWAEKICPKCPFKIQRGKHSQEWVDPVARVLTDQFEETSRMLRD